LITNSNSTTEILNNSGQPAEDGDLLSTYFELQIDRQIPDEVICSLLKEITNRGDNLRLDYDIECSSSDLVYAETELNRNIVAPGVEIAQEKCDEEQGGSGCRS